MNLRFKHALTAAACGLAIAGPGLFGADAERFDMKVRNDFFAGFGGDAEALDRGMKSCETAMKEDPNQAEPMVWHGAGLLYQSGAYFQKGDMQNGGEFWGRAIKEMDDAVAMAPDDVGVRIPRGAALLAASAYIPPERAKPLIEKALSDYERTLELQAAYFDTLGEHPRGQLLFGLADGYSRVGDQEKAALYFTRIEKDLPGTVYATRAAKWMETKSLTPEETRCAGCHVAK